MALPCEFAELQLHTAHTRGEREIYTNVQSVSERGSSAEMHRSDALCVARAHTSQSRCGPMPARVPPSQSQRLTATATGTHPRGTPPLTVSPPYIELNIERAPAKADACAPPPRALDHGTSSSISPRPPPPPHCSTPLTRPPPPPRSPPPRRRRSRCHPTPRPRRCRYRPA